MSNEEKELLRHAALECLATRHPAALPLAGVARRVATQVDFVASQAEVQGALELLEGLGLVSSHVDELGSSKWWVATADGVLKVERK